jgi:hypothetical protein
MPSNPYSTGGGGSDFERRVATGYVCAALARVPVPPFSECATKISLQAGHLGAVLDDMVLELRSKDGSTRRIYVSVKSAVSPRASDEPFTETLFTAWKQWQAGENFDRSNDAFVLAAAMSRAPRIYLFGRLTEIARAAENDADFEARLSREVYHSSTVRELLPECKGVIEQRIGVAPKTNDVWRFLRSFFVSIFDFDASASQDKARTIGILRLTSDSRDGTAAESCWNTVFEMVSRDTAEARVFDEQALTSIAHDHKLRRDGSARAAAWLNNLRAHSRIARRSIATTLLVNHRHLDRERLLQDFRTRLSAGRFVLVTGPAGSGKSALALEGADSVVQPDNIFCFQSEEFAYPHLDNALQAAGLRDLNAEEWADALPFDRRVLFVEAAERLLQSSRSREAFTQLLRITATDRRWSVVVTCRDYLADHVRDTWEVEGGWDIVEVPLLEPADVQELTRGSKIPAEWLVQPTISDALRNLKWLDLTMRAVERLRGDAPSSAWASLAEWRRFLWRQLLQPNVHPSWQELLIDVSVQRVTLGSLWVLVDAVCLPATTQLVGEGILRRHNGFTNQFRSEHDLLEDWALLVHAERQFAKHGTNPKQLFAELGTSLIVRRAFRHFFGEHLEGDQCEQGFSFIRQVLADPDAPKEWKKEIAIALLGSASALNALNKTAEIWTDANGEGLQLLCHVLRIAYLTKSEDAEPERPFGPGWAALMAFIEAEGDAFLRQHAQRITSVLLDWHHAVTPDCPEPIGLKSAAELVRGLWCIATEGEERFEQYWGEEHRHYPADANRLSWLVAAVAGALQPKFFIDATRVALDENRDFGSDRFQRNRQCRELLEFLVADHAGWVLARAHPRTMVRLCLESYGLTKRREPRYRGGFGSDRSCGLTTRQLDFSPPSAFRGPFLELLRHHPNLGQAFILRLVNEATRRWADQSDDGLALEHPFEIRLQINGEEITQVADQGWWRCYRGWSPYDHVLECALMAFEKWLLEDVGATRVEELEPTLLALMSASRNVAVTAVCASVATVYWWHCGHVAAALLQCWPLLDLDRHRWMNDQTQGGWRTWRDEHSIYLEERQQSNALPHHREHLEHLILKAQLGPGRSEVWPVLDALHTEASQIPPAELTDAIQTVRLILHRIDARNLKAEPSTDTPGQVLLQPAPPPEDLQKHLDIVGEEMRTKSLPMEMQSWAAQILEPLGVVQPQPERWREFLKKAREFDVSSLDAERAFVFGDSPTMVAAACLRDHSAELDPDEWGWCVVQVTGVLLEHAELTEWRSGSLLTTWQAECAAARTCGVLATMPSNGTQANQISRAVAIALTHPEKRVRVAAAAGLGQSASDSPIHLMACELLIQHSRYCRTVDLRHRGPQRLAYEHITTWQDRCAEMHKEILIETQRLRERFIAQQLPNVRRLELFYPRAHEEEQNLPGLLLLLLRHRSVTATALVNRIRNWLAIQLIDESHQRCGRRRFAADKWRDHYGSFSRTDPVNTGDVGRIIARRVLAGTPEEACEFYRSILTDDRIAHLGSKAGEFLQDLCITLDEEGQADVFWAVWEKFAGAAVGLGTHLNDKEYWRQRKTSASIAGDAFDALLAALFLNRMYFKPDQAWRPLDGQLGRFSEAFAVFKPFALNKYISFFNTVGGGSLPSAFVEVDACVRTLLEQTKKSFLTRSSENYLLRLIKRHALAGSLGNDENQTSAAILHLLDVLADAGSAEAFRLRETLARTGP